jgi:hypothetical protein
VDDNLVRPVQIDHQRAEGVSQEVRKKCEGSKAKFNSRLVGKDGREWKLEQTSEEEDKVRPFFVHAILLFTGTSEQNRKMPKSLQNSKKIPIQVREESQSLKECRQRRRFSARSRLAILKGLIQVQFVLRRITGTRTRCLFAS